MKTTTKTIAFMFAVLIFAACREQVIEPAKSTYRLQPGIISVDTITRPVRTVTIDDNKLMLVSDHDMENEPLPNSGLQPITCPTPNETPTPTVIPVVASDSLVQM